MGWLKKKLKKAFKSVKKVFKKVGKSIKKAFGKVGEFFGKFGVWSFRLDFLISQCYNGY